jgi:hypothetical protein
MSPVISLSIERTRAMVSRQLNLRFDEQHHDVVRRVVDRLRRDSTFLASLEALLASDSTPAGDHHAPEMRALFALLERRVDLLEPRIDALEAARPAPQPRPARVPASAPSAPADDASAEAAGAWTMGDKSKRLTPAGRAEVVRRIRGGARDTEIGRAVGVHRETVRRIRKELPALAEHS